MRWLPLLKSQRGAKAEVQPLIEEGPTWKVGLQWVVPRLETSHTDALISLGTGLPIREVWRGLLLELSEESTQRSPARLLTGPCIYRVPLDRRSAYHHPAAQPESLLSRGTQNCRGVIYRAESV